MKPINPEQLLGPVVEASRVEGPTTHMRQALPFTEIELASLQFLRVAAELFFRRFAFLNIDTRAVPLDDPSIFIPQGDFVMQHPAVLTVSSANARFVQESLPTGQRSA